MTPARSIHVIGAALVVVALLLWVGTGTEGFTRWPNERLERSDAPTTPGESELLAEVGFASEAAAPVQPTIESRFAFGLVPGGPDPRHLLSVATIVLLVMVVSSSALFLSRRRASRLAVAALASLLPFAALAATSTDSADPPAQKPPAGCAEPQPPESLPADTIIYRTLTGREAQVTFTSAAPLERIVGKSNGIVGFALEGPRDEPAKLAGATWVLPVATLATGLPLRDEHMISSAWLDAAAHPEIRFELTRVDAIRELKRGEDFSTWSGTLVGRMTLHGVTREMQVPDARLSFLKESARTRTIAPGNLLFLKCDYTIKLSDFGIMHADVPGKVADVVTLSQMLRLSSAAPEVIKKAAASVASQS